MILGVDEVGRGPWAGPLVVGAVILGATPNDALWQDLNDSKKLAAKKREILNKLVLEHATATGLGWVSSAEIDRYGLSSALKLATRRAVKKILHTKQPFTEIIIDGTINLLDETPLAERVTLLKKADSLVKEVSAASIIAKVARDQYMIELSTKYPSYGFENHVGYGTAAHKSALEDLGPCPEHRRSFRPVREIAARFALQTDQDRNSASRPDGQNRESTKTSNNFPAKHTLGRNNTALGRTAEHAAAEYLSTHGHSILMQNFKTKICEIDLISIKNDEIVFTEVKYHQNSAYGTPLEQITSKKHAQLHRSAEIFLKLYPKYQNFQPRLAAASVLGPDYQVADFVMLTD